MRYLLVVESVDDLLSLPNEEPLLMEAPNSLTLDGGGKELAELSLNVDAESRSPADRSPGEGFRNDELDPPLSDKRPYSPNFLGGGINERAGLALLLLAFELKESPPSDFLRWLTSVSGKRLYSPKRLGRPLLCEERGGLGRELGGKLSGHRPDGLSVEAALRCFCEVRPCFSNSSMSPDSFREGGRRYALAPVSNSPPEFELTPASNGLGIFPFLCAVTGLVNPGKQQRPR